MQELRKSLLETPSAFLSPGTFGRAVLSHESEHLRAPKTLAGLHPLPLGGRPLQDAEREKGSWGGDMGLSLPGHGSVISSPRGEARGECHPAHSRGALSQPGVPRSLQRCCPHFLARLASGLCAPPPCPAALWGFALARGLPTRGLVASEAQTRVCLLAGRWAGGLHVWSSSQEKPQVQPSKSINK